MNTLRAGGFLVQSAEFDCTSWETGEWNRLVSLFKVCTCVRQHLRVESQFMTTMDNNNGNRMAMMIILLSISEHLNISNI